MSGEHISEMLERQRRLSAYLAKHTELSFALESEVIFKKAFVVACGSFCERALTDALEEFASRHRDERLTCFVRNRALERRYHEMFDWKAANANRFFAWFGESFKKRILDILENDSELSESVKAFMLIGRMRNLIAHDFASSTVDHTLEELHVLWKGAVRFLDFVRVQLGKQEDEGKGT